MRLLERLQSLPEKPRKIILWSIVSLLGILLLIWWFSGLQERLAGFQGKQFLEKLNLPDVKAPSLPREDLDKLKQELKTIDASQNTETTQ